MKIDRRFTSRRQNPYEGITFVKRSSEIRNPDGSTAIWGGDLRFTGNF